jgi:hypothetical protein
MVFSAETAPRTRPAFMEWFAAQVTWSEEHAYDDPNITTLALRSWLRDMRQTFPDMNGPNATDETEKHWTDYTIGKYIIYVAFGWSVSEEACETVYRLAAKHRVGFFDVSDDGVAPSILLPQDGILKMLEEINTQAQQKPWWKVW